MTQYRQNQSIFLNLDGFKNGCSPFQVILSCSSRHHLSEKIPFFTSAASQLCLKAMDLCRDYVLHAASCLSQESFWAEMQLDTLLTDFFVRQNPKIHPWKPACGLHSLLVRQPARFQIRKPSESMCAAGALRFTPSPTAQELISEL